LTIKSKVLCASRSIRVTVTTSPGAGLPSMRLGLRRSARAHLPLRLDSSYQSPRKTPRCCYRQDRAQILRNNLTRRPIVGPTGLECGSMEGIDWRFVVAVSGESIVRNPWQISLRREFTAFITSEFTAFIRRKKRYIPRSEGPRCDKFLIFSFTAIFKAVSPNYS
jgi:hypothetical protein